MRIRYVNDFGFGAYSSEVDFTPFELASTPVFTANTGKKTLDGLSVVTEWSTSTFTGGFTILHYLIKFSGNAGRVVSLISQNNVVGNSYTYPYSSTTAVDQNLYIDVCAVTISNEDAVRLVANPLLTVTSYQGASTSMTRRRYDTAQQVRNLVAVEGDTQVSISWDEPVDFGFQSGDVISTIYRITPSIGQTVHQTERTIVLPNLPNGGQVTVNVQAVVTYNVTGEMILGHTNSLMCNPFTISTAPTNIQVTASDEQILVTWDPPTDTGGRQIDRYVLTLLNEEDGSTNILPLAPIALNTYTYTLATDGISNGLQYSISIQPVTKKGGVDIFGSTSASISTIPFGVPIISPTVTIAGNVLTFRVSPNGSPLLRYMVLAKDEDPVSTETLFKTFDVTDVYPDVLTGTIEIPVTFTDFSSDIFQYLIIVFSATDSALINTFLVDGS